MLNNYIEYKIFYVNYNPNEDAMIEEMNNLITTKLNEGWKCVGGIAFVHFEGMINKIFQAMTKC